MLTHVIKRKQFFGLQRTFNVKPTVAKKNPETFDFYK